MREPLRSSSTVAGKQALPRRSLALPTDKQELPRRSLGLPTDTQAQPHRWLGLPTGTQVPPQKSSLPTGGQGQLRKLSALSFDRQEPFQRSLPTVELEPLRKKVPPDTLEWPTDVPEPMRFGKQGRLDKSGLPQAGRLVRTPSYSLAWLLFGRLEQLDTCSSVGMRSPWSLFYRTDRSQLRRDLQTRLSLHSTGTSCC